jgi:methyl-accepting chemotaxis protein
MTNRELAHATREGRFDMRLSADRLPGDWGSMARSLNTALQEMLAPIQESATVLEKIADGDLRVRVVGNYKGDHTKMQNAVNAAATVLQDAMVKLSDAVGQITAASGQIADGSSALARGTAEQASAINKPQHGTNGWNDRANSRKHLRAKGAESRPRLTKAPWPWINAQIMGQIRAAAKELLLFAKSTKSRSKSARTQRGGRSRARRRCGTGFAVVAEECAIWQCAKEAARKQTSSLTSYACRRRTRRVGSYNI